jgi:N-succinyl-L-ornithine transcarbamylase
VVLSWAPHPKSLPQAVANTLWNDAVTKCRFCNNTSKGYELNPEITKFLSTTKKQGFENADFIYTKTGVVTATMENY